MPQVYKRSRLSRASFVDLELEPVTALYRQLGIPEKGHVAPFDGPHKGTARSFPLPRQDAELDTTTLSRYDKTPQFPVGA
jgi:hypothetical protein